MKNQKSFEKKDIKLSVVVLCYREGKRIIPFIDRLEVLLNSLNISWEMILVGNYIEGSDDKTQYIVKEIEKNKTNVKAIAEPKKGMMGWDMRKGMELAIGEYICVIDGDGQFPIESIALCYDKMKENRYDLIKTYRQRREDGFYRILISKIYNFIFKILFPGVKFRDVNSKPKLIRREAYNKIKNILKSDDWFIDAEIMILARRYDFNIGEIPVNFYSLKNKRASFVKFTAILEFIKNLIIYRIKEFLYEKKYFYYWCFI